ncbi:hypothetical protein [Desulforamulus aquiferis]|uniref:HTH merR-type domain-containing protein n=1 Tax=Desulforamulus aquiferis TaxID=1397668 RepID=A0AAW7ZMD4_9FIRM|nr:hypothetical protein [Desulforamulus aquiferis]MDO7789105.1 hypothetical protein [Desulforamulus aquiferis]RYD02871.1 hypothetical protein N752_22935 [Desulforamulus aquiferis]
MGKKVTFSEGAELLRVPISTISKWFSQGFFKSVELDKKGPNGPVYLLKVEELLAIKDALEAEARGEELAKKEIAASSEKKKNNAPDGGGRRKLSLIKSASKPKETNHLEQPSPGKEIVLRIQEDTAAGLINTLHQYLNNFEERFIEHMEQQADKNIVKYNTMAIEHLETLKDLSNKMEKVVDALVTTPHQVSSDTLKIVNEIKDMMPEINYIGEMNKGTNEKLEAVSKKLEKLGEEIKDTKWAVVKMAREKNKVGKKAKVVGAKSLLPSFGVTGWVSGIGKFLRISK